MKFPITVVNKAEKPIDIGWTHINVQSKDKEADQFYDSLSGLKGPPAKKVSKGREATFEVGFAVADPDDLTMELALDGDRQRPVFDTPPSQRGSRRLILAANPRSSCGPEAGKLRCRVDNGHVDRHVA